VSDTNNPYQASAAVMDGEPAGGATYEPKFWALTGRIGRLRYLAYLFGISCLTMIAIGIAGAVLAMLQLSRGSTEGFDMMTVVMVILYIPLVVYSFVLARRRFNDTGRSGWLCLLLLVPLVNALVSLYLVFAPGTDGPNEYGVPPSQNSWLVVAGGIVMPLVFIVGVMAAVAIPAYQSYVAKAQAARAGNGF
jgi:uncharacterized membrane protein YhaH (DUF805 family)